MWIIWREKLHREPVLKDWAEVNDALRSIHEYEHALTEMGVDMSRRIDAVKAEYTKSAEPLQKRVKQLETDVQEYVEAHREDMAGKSRQLTFGRVGFRQSTRLILANAKVPQAIATLLAMGRRELVKTEQKLDRTLSNSSRRSSGGCGRVSENHGMNFSTTRATPCRRSNRKEEQLWVLETRKRRDKIYLCAGPRAWFVRFSAGP